MILMPWKFHNPTQIHFADGAVESLPLIVAGLAVERPIVVTTAGMMKRGLGTHLGRLFPSRSIPIVDHVNSNPSLTQLLSLKDICAAHQPDCIIAWGGGSVIDAAKVISSCLAAPTTWNLESALLHGQAWHGQQLIPVIAIPTTAGTGAEVTPFATVWDTEQQKKLSLAHPSMFPIVAIVDPQQLDGSPVDVLVSCGLDAISQAFESYWNRHATPITDRLALQSLEHSLPIFENLVSASPSVNDFTHIAEASLLAGICISQTRTALAHALSYPMTARFGVPHGLACGITLPAILRFNEEADSENKLLRLSQQLGHNSVESFAMKLDQLLQNAGTKSLMKRYIPQTDAILPFASEMVYPGRSDNNMRTAVVQDIEQILIRSL